MTALKLLLPTCAAVAALTMATNPGGVLGTLSPSTRDDLETLGARGVIAWDSPDVDALPLVRGHLTRAAGETWVVLCGEGRRLWAAGPVIDRAVDGDGSQYVELRAAAPQDVRDWRAVRAGYTSGNVYTAEIVARRVELVRPASGTDCK